MHSQILKFKASWFIRQIGNKRTDGWTDRQTDRRRGITDYFTFPANVVGKHEVVYL